MHEKHRERMRARYLKEGGRSFADHEILEMFLYTAIPRCDTNLIAHRLLKRFGSIKNLLMADLEELIEVEGVGEKTAFSIMICLDMLRRFQKGDEREKPVYTHISDVVTYLYPLFLGATRETLYLMLFNNRMNLLDCVSLSEGGATFTEVSPGKILDHAIRKKAAAVVLAHNHPAGVAVPSQNDLDATEKVYDLLDAVNISLIDHVIIAEDRFHPIIKYRKGPFHPGPIRIDQGMAFYERFYDLDDTTYRIPTIME